MDAQETTLTPLMTQYWELKNQAPDALLFFRMGDFYELFGPDAVEASKLLEITLTSRDRNKENALPMAGVPHHAAAAYLKKLLSIGKKVAIAEQVEDPVESKKKGAKVIVRREITQILTPALQFDLEGARENYLACLIEVDADSTSSRSTRGTHAYLLCAIDPSTGNVIHTGVSSPKSASEWLDFFSQISIAHLITTRELPPEARQVLGKNIFHEVIPDTRVRPEQAIQILTEIYGVENPEVLLVESGERRKWVVQGFGILFDQFKKSLPTRNLERNGFFKKPRPLQNSNQLLIPPSALKALEVLEGPTSLVDRIERTVTSAGSRLFRSWLSKPFADVVSIEKRQNQVQCLKVFSPAVFQELRSELGKTYDLNRINGRITTGNASPRDVLAWTETVLIAGRWLDAFQRQPVSGSEKTRALFQDLLVKMESSLTPIAPLAKKFLGELISPAPLISNQGGIYQETKSPELQKWIHIAQKGHRWIVDYETSQREQTGISSLKVKYNRVFGYSIEVTSTHLSKVPAHYIRKQTMAGGERYFTEELKKFEEEVLTADSVRIRMEREFFQEDLRILQTQVEKTQDLCDVLAEWDALFSLVVLAQQPGWNFPVIDDSRNLSIQKGRHPLVDDDSGKFVPNSISLDEKTSALLITGPNMGGKSTYMRQVALIVLLGQMGAPVPATVAHWGVVSSLWTRIGAHDLLSQGLSTFMVEMTELAQILHQANNRSLVILDEIGRGTSTYDGLSVAWASLEYLLREMGCRTLFATHYHELTAIEESFPTLKNVHMGVEVLEDSQLHFTFRVLDGAAEKSFGIEVARMAGIPRSVVDRASSVLEKMNQPEEPSSITASETSSKIGLKTRKSRSVEPSSKHLDQLKLF